jgi:malate dehydrogenase (oxaloacetate-decarboxylating)
MLAAAAHAVAGLSDATTPGLALLPPGDNLRLVSATVAVAAVAAGLTQVDLADPIGMVHTAMWRPEYPTIQPVYARFKPIIRTSAPAGPAMPSPPKPWAAQWP